MTFPPGIHTVQPGQVLTPMHDDTLNRLTYPRFDPYSRPPNSRHCAVRIETAESGLIDTPPS